MKLCILIPTLNDSYNINKLTRLKNVLVPQIERHREVSILINDAGRAMPTGTKRNELIKNSDSEYFSMIDDDDMVPSFYVSELLKAIESNPDVVTFNGWMTNNGTGRKNFVIKLGEKYEERNGVYYRYPNHLCAFKRSVVSHVRFPAIWQQEDYQWATEIMHKKLLQTEVHINEDLYHYDCYPNKNETSRKVRRTNFI